MRLATLRDGSRDGRLLVVSRDGLRAIDAGAAAPTLQAALDDWDRAAPSLLRLSAELHRGSPAAFELELEALAAPLPRAAEWVDGSAYLNHVRLVRRARLADPPATLETDPLVYQGGSSDMLGSREPFRLLDESYGLDLEAELGVVLGDTPIGTRESSAAKHVRLLVCLNDWTYRNLVPDELAKGFGFFCSKPATGFAPFAVTPDELSSAWLDGRLDGTMYVAVDDKRLGDPLTGPEMHFSFFQLVEHICRTRRFGAGTLLGSGTISNRAPERGSSCLQELRARETIASGAPQTPFLHVGSRVQIELRLADGSVPFGSIDQQVVGA
ncbi:MAG TPA: fumarylacetoacetate hydrolase family protein [Polyangiaceae bacterium]|nr:fumarylacetoacetate hydrolase family protein [Polyangiaceae bacterium]